MKQTPQKLNKSMELLAPAGTIESFHAAIDCGANAVYVGLVEFSARMRARNFTMKTLSYAVPYAHSHGVKVYVAFNTLVKQAELEHAVHCLYQLEQIGVDAVIVQDLGIAKIVKTAFPRLRLHGSTQLAVHNSSGLETCAKLGMSRVVLAREMTLEEIKSVCNAKKAEVEVFVHGALCYSLSGMCLASSFFGGASGNRGRCTQVCRRSFDVVSGDGELKQGYFFSPNDLSALDFLPDLANAGVKSLKIEGRMKGSDYVRTVVSAYRLALDCPEKISVAKEMLRKDMGRRKSKLFLPGVTQEGIIDAKNPAGTGIFIGIVTVVQDNTITVMTNESIDEKDMIRLQPATGAEGIMAFVAQCTKNGKTLTILPDKSIACSVGDSLYCIGKNTEKESETTFNSTPAPFTEFFKTSNSLLRTLTPKVPVGKNSDRRLFIKIDDYAWLEHLESKEIGGVICAFDTVDMRKLAADAEVLKRFGRALYIEPPPFIAEDSQGEWRRLIQTLCKDNECGLFCNNLGHLSLEPGVKRMRSDYMVWCMNRASQYALEILDSTFFSYSLEDDAMNIRDCRSQHGMLYLFEHIPLFISRMEPGTPSGTHLKDRIQRKTVTRQKHGLYYLIAEESVSLFHKRDLFEEMGIKLFAADLSFMPVDKKKINDVISCYTSFQKYPGSCLFNMKGGLK